MTLQRRISWALGALVALFVVAQGVLLICRREQRHAGREIVCGNQTLGRRLKA